MRVSDNGIRSILSSVIFKVILRSASVCPWHLLGTETEETSVSFESLYFSYIYVNAATVFDFGWLQVFLACLSSRPFNCYLFLFSGTVRSTISILCCRTWRAQCAVRLRRRWRPATQAEWRWRRRWPRWCPSSASLPPWSPSPRRHPPLRLWPLQTPRAAGVSRHGSWTSGASGTSTGSRPLVSIARVHYLTLHHPCPQWQ